MQTFLYPSGCYPSWEFLRGGWTASGRTFEARLGFAPEIGSADRQALFDAFASMTFARGTVTPASSVVIATGTAGGEEWQLVASGQADGLSLSLQAETFGTGTGGFDPRPDELQITSHVFGDYGDREMVIFGAVPARITTIEAFPPDDAPAISADVLEVPDEIDARFNGTVALTEVRSCRAPSHLANGQITRASSAKASESRAPGGTSVPRS